MRSSYARPSGPRILHFGNEGKTSASKLPSATAPRREEGRTPALCEEDKHSGPATVWTEAPPLGGRPVVGTSSPKPYPVAGTAVLPGDRHVLSRSSPVAGTFSPPRRQARSVLPSGRHVHSQSSPVAGTFRPPRRQVRSLSILPGGRHVPSSPAAGYKVLTRVPAA